MIREPRVDWLQCELIEVVPGKVSGHPLVKGTRVPAEAILENYDGGSPVEEIAENYPSVSEDKIRRLIQFAAEHRPQEHAVR